MLKNLLNFVLLKITVFFVSFTSKISTESRRQYNLKEIVKAYQKCDIDYLQVRRFPKSSSSIINNNYFTKIDTSQYAIIIRGLLILKDNFTLETVKIYSKLFPKAKLIIVSWNDSEYDNLYKILENLGCYTIKLEKIQNNGVSNINAQMLQMQSGLKLSQKLGCKYSLITRADQRVYYGYTLEYLTCLTEQFPVNNNTNFCQHKRIITTCCFQNRVTELPPFFLRDLLYFGYVDDLLDFFDNPPTEKTQEDYRNIRKVKGQLTIWEECEYDFSPEYYHSRNYIERHLGQVVNKQDYSLWWDIIRDILITISPHDISLYPYKYDVKYYISSPQVCANGTTYESRNYDFKKWLMIYYNLVDIGKSDFQSHDKFQNYWVGWY